MDMHESIQMALTIAAPFGVVAWAIVQFFSRRIVASLDANSEQLKSHAEMMTNLGQTLKELNLQFTHNNQLTGNELKLLSQKHATIDAEIMSLRADRHGHGNEITKLLFTTGANEKRLDKVEALANQNKADRVFLTERMHDIINALNSLWGIARHTHDWPLPEVPDIRQRSSKEN